MHPVMAVDLGDLRRVFARGGNLMEYMREARRSDANDELSILYAYDLQAGSYVASMADAALAEHKRAVGRKLAGVLESLGARVVCEAGVGEATTLAEVVAAGSHLQHVLGFDVSLSRLLHARAYLARRGFMSPTLFTGSLEAIPLPTASVEVVYTFHSMEPNGGREREIVEELLRVARHHLVLVEPSNELGGDATRARIARHRYVKDLRRTLDAVGARVVRFERWGLDANPENEAALIVVEKRPQAPGAEASMPMLASPLSRAPLVSRADCLYSPEDGLAFPRIQGIPCLLAANGVVATRLLDFDEPPASPSS